MCGEEKYKWFLSCRLEFECTHNKTEYEALVQSLRKTIELNVRNLKFFDDSEIVIRKIRDTIHCLSPHLKGYQAEVWNLISHFNAFNINSIPRLQKVAAYFLVVSSSRLVPTNNKCSIKLIFRPSIANMLAFYQLDSIILGSYLRE